MKQLQAFLSSPGGRAGGNGRGARWALGGILVAEVREGSAQPFVRRDQRAPAERFDLAVVEAGALPVRSGFVGRKHGRKLTLRPLVIAFHPPRKEERGAVGHPNDAEMADFLSISAEVFRASR